MYLTNGGQGTISPMRRYEDMRARSTHVYAGPTNGYNSAYTTNHVHDLGKKNALTATR